ncbi:MAG: tetratricopeptide repeat protein [Anaerolineaceae bacterium]|nr:tetratricopeptide repeat protein [Anaerolineaceae bacterium]
MFIDERKNLFRNPRGSSNPYFVMAILLVVVALVAVVRAFAQGEIWPPFIPTPTPTRTVNSFVIEGDTHFQAGSLEKAIQSYQQALVLEPDNAHVRANLATIMVYSSYTMTTDQERLDRLNQALDVIDIAKADQPNNSEVLGVRANVLSSLSNSNLPAAEKEEYRNQAESEALIAIQLDNNNLLAKAYYAEILMDQFKYEQANDYISQARAGEGESLMDVCRIQAYIYEMFREYNLAIDWYKRASELAPNLTFLYNRIGVLYRYLGQYEESRYETALEYFARAAGLNNQLGIDDPIPYMAIANTYIRMGEAMAASRNAYRALEINPYNPDTYGQVGVIYYRARNYEGAIQMLRCAVVGCDAEQSCEAREEDPCESDIVISGLPLTNTTVLYYYTYGSALAGLHRPGIDDNCTEAAVVFQKIRQQFSDNEEVMYIVRASENICRINPDEALPTELPTATPMGTPTPVPTETPMAIPTLTPARP